MIAQFDPMLLGAIALFALLCWGAFMLLMNAVTDKSRKFWNNNQRVRAVAGLACYVTFGTIILSIGIAAIVQLLESVIL